MPSNVSLRSKPSPAGVCVVPDPKETAGPSTALRSGRDDNSVWERIYLVSKQNCQPEELTCLRQVKDGMNENGDCLLGPAPQQHCHPDRSEAKWRDLLCAFTPNEGPTSELVNPAQAVCSLGPERSVVEGPAVSLEAFTTF